MEELDFSNVKDPKAVAEQIKRMVVKGLISKESAGIVRVSDIFKFIEQEIGKKAVKAYENKERVLARRNDSLLIFLIVATPYNSL